VFDFDPEEDDEDYELEDEIVFSPGHG